MCYDVRLQFYLQMFTQLIKQTAGLCEAELESPSVLSYWQTMACMCCTFFPERAIKRDLIMHINKYANITLLLEEKWVGEGLIFKY